jgi:hypothetical protein
MSLRCLKVGRRTPQSFLVKRSHVICTNTANFLPAKERLPRVGPGRATARPLPRSPSSLLKAGFFLKRSSVGGSTLFFVSQHRRKRGVRRPRPTPRPPKRTARSSLPCLPSLLARSPHAVAQPPGRLFMRATWCGASAVARLLRLLF